MNTKTVNLFECGHCSKVWRTEKDADKCCLCIDCGKPKDFDLPNVLCRSCQSLRNYKSFQKMPTVPYTGQVVYDDYHNNFWFSLEDLADWIANEEGKVTLWLRDTKKIEPTEFCVENFLEDDPENELSYDYDEAEKLEEEVNKFLVKAQGDLYSPAFKKIDLASLMEQLDEETRSQIDLEESQ